MANLETHDRGRSNSPNHSETKSYINSDEFDEESTKSSVHEEVQEEGENDIGERVVAYQALDSFNKYRSMQHMTIHRRRQNLYALPSSQWKLLASPPFNLLDNLAAVDDAIDTNSKLADAIVDTAVASGNFPHDKTTNEQAPWNGFAKINDHNKAQSTIRQFYRDWTAEGYEREIKPLLDILLRDLAKYGASSTPSESNVLLPGSGLSRLLLELTLHGYNCTGNEISFHQLMASNFILNSNPRGANSWTIYPWASNFCNNISRNDQLQAYAMPDLDPATAVAEARARGDPVGQMGMAAGDFCTSFNNSDSAEMFSSVVTAYFIDTSPNLFRYIQAVHNCLQPGGLWINVGPLLWHFDGRAPHEEDNTATHKAENGVDAHRQATSHAFEKEDTGIAEPGSFELTHEEILALVAHSGFEICSNEILRDIPDDTAHGNSAGLYLQDPKSMMQMQYRCSHWVARKL